jgi:exodeoxyribonuclease X
LNAYIYDTETTGVDPAKDRIIQDAFLAVTFSDGELFCLSGPSVELWGSSVPISYGAMAVHRITEKDIAGLPEWAGFSYILGGTDYMIGHKVDFDWAMAGKPDVRRICTLAIARNVYPDASSHSLSAVHLMQQNGSAEAIADLANAHDAGADVVLCLRVLSHMLRTFRPDIQDMQALWDWSEKCRIPVRWDFGKFKGKAIGEADTGYMNWYLRQEEQDPYYTAALKQYLGRR